MENKEYMNIPQEKFNFVNREGQIHDKELVTKPVGYFKDAFNRFRRNKGSIFAAFIIMFLVLFAIIAPIISPYTVSYNDADYRYKLPRNEICYSLNIPFWDGCEKVAVPKETFLLDYAIGIETGRTVVKNQDYEITEKMLPNKKTVPVYAYRKDTYTATGLVFKNLSKKEYEEIQKYQDETGIQVIYPITEPSLRPTATQDNANANYWYTTIEEKTKTVTTNYTVDADGTIHYQDIYRKYTGNDGYTSKVRFEGEGNYKYDYAEITDGGFKVRISYYDYYGYYHSYVLKDGITKPSFLFGSDNQGKDILTCLASGARFSFILAIIVATVNLIVGAIYGAIEGYYGGKIDLIMERFVEILSAVPFMIVITLLKYHMKGSSHIIVLFISFFLTGWIGMAGRTRMQFYRFKNQEYVLASRTLGAKDARIMFKHIFPNALGTLITSCVLVIPGMIFSETSLSYLGIINLSTGKLTSVGTLLATGQQYLVTHPYMIVTPSLFISLLMLSFNLFGNGLRDAFNPSLRGSED